MTVTFPDKGCAVTWKVCADKGCAVAWKAYLFLKQQFKNKTRINVLAMTLLPIFWDPLKARCFTLQLLFGGPLKA